jgi:hypothetical protein
VRNLLEVKPKIPLFGVRSTDIPLQGISTSSKPTVEGQRHQVSRARGNRLAKKALSGCVRGKLEKARARAGEAGTGGIQQPGYAGVHKQGETSIEIFKRSRSEGSTSHRKDQSSKKAQGF